jgi:Txe/YoeB family toxin of Txe-Axe toxin-antitoxin module
MKSQVVFGDEKIKGEFDVIKDLQLKKQLKKAIQNLEENAFLGIQIPKRLIPKEYFFRFGKLDNLWKYNLPDAWRLIYTVKNNRVSILSILLDWLDHKSYERKFNY